MWYIQIAMNITNNTHYEFTSLQILEKHIIYIYDSIQCISNEDYKILNNSLQNHIVKYINNMSAYKIELVVYNYGIDNAILLLNNYNNDNKKYINTSSKSLLFIIFYNMFTICYITNYKNDNKKTDRLTKYYPDYAIIIIQRFWRKILSYRMETNKDKINKDISNLINKINNEIVGESAKNVLLYLVNKFKKRISRTLRI
jgi:hypothetical protein